MIAATAAKAPVASRSAAPWLRLSAPRIGLCNPAIRSSISAFDRPSCRRDQHLRPTGTVADRYGFAICLPAPPRPIWTDSALPPCRTPLAPLHRACPDAITRHKAGLAPPSRADGPRASVPRPSKERGASLQDAPPWRESVPAPAIGGLPGTRLPLGNGGALGL